MASPTDRPGSTQVPTGDPAETGGDRCGEALQVICWSSALTIDDVKTKKGGAKSRFGEGWRRVRRAIGWQGHQFLIILLSSIIFLVRCWVPENWPNRRGLDETNFCGRHQGSPPWFDGNCTVQHDAPCEAKGIKKYTK